MNGLSIFGANSLARLLIEFVREDGGAVESVVVDDERWSSESFHGVPALRYSSVRRPTRIVSAVGYKDMRARQRVFLRLQRDGHDIANYISPRADISRSVQMGTGNILMPGVVIEPLARIGSGNLFWSRTLICHEVTVGDHNYIAANCVVGGHSKIGDLCFMGNSSTTIDGVALADETHVLPGSILFENTKAHTKYFGAPARAVGFHKDTGIVIKR
jgi:UDP-N-acetylbacillosamine N-acetyltransferase